MTDTNDPKFSITLEQTDISSPIRVHKPLTQRPKVSLPLSIRRQENSKSLKKESVMSDKKSLENSSAMRNFSSSKPAHLYLGSKAMRVRANLSPLRPQKPNSISLDFQDPGQISVDQDKGPSLTNEKISLRALISQQKHESEVSRPTTQIHDETGQKDSPAKGKNLFFKDDKEWLKWRENDIVNYYRRENG
jgi:hypothetical protein